MNEEVEGADEWELEEDARTIRHYFKLKGEPDRYAAAFEVVRKESSALAEELKKQDEYKEKIGFSKK